MTELVLPNRVPDDLRCPQCRGSMFFDGDVECAVCSSRFPVTNGIPRFVEQQHLASFGFQWNRFEVVCDQNRLSISVNGKVTIRADEIDPTCGFIQIESVNAEIYFRRLELLPLGITQNQ